jgi:hypothetical protein
MLRGHGWNIYRLLRKTVGEQTSFSGAGSFALLAVFALGNGADA